MICIDKHSRDPWFNLAADEYVLKQKTDDVFMLWESAECIVVGKHQLPQMEIDLQIIDREGVPLIRRISGGGTVYHGPGNINFSFITNESGDKINFKKFLIPIQMYLSELGVKVDITSKSNLTINGLKISVNAASVYHNRSLHHGTLLFSSDTQRLNALLKKSFQNYETKAVHSNRTEVTTISNNLSGEISSGFFFNGLKKKVFDYFEIQDEIAFTEEEQSVILKLSEEKYKTFAWNFGYSPDYQIHCNTDLHGENVYFLLQIKQGRVNTVISGDGRKLELIAILKNNLIQVPHLRKHILEVLLPFQSRLSENENEFNKLINNIL